MRAICDTHVLLFHALAPERLSRLAARAVAAGTENGQLACADISLWEIGMLHARDSGAPISRAIAVNHREWPR